MFAPAGKGATFSCTLWVIHYVQCENWGSAAVPGVGNSVTKKLLEKLCLARCPMAPLCFIKWNALLYNVDPSVIKLVHILQPRGAETLLSEIEI